MCECAAGGRIDVINRELGGLVYEETETGSLRPFRSADDRGGDPDILRGRRLAAVWKQLDICGQQWQQGDEYLEEGRRQSLALSRFPGNIASNCWVDDEYFVESTGIMATDKWLKLPKRNPAWNETSATTVWYYFSTSGKMVSDGWSKIGGKYYYFDGDGAMQTAGG